ncbi:MAG: thioredoxin domain-containing protein [Candidatus Omnitrophota bacterium]
MNTTNRKIIFVFCLLMAFGFLATLSFAQQAQNPTVEQQLQKIIDNQGKIEQRLSNLERMQAGLANGLRALSTQGAQAPSRPPEIDPNQVYEINISQFPIQGKKDAKVTIVEASEVQCPYSRRFHPVLEEVLKAYPNDVNHVFLHFPLGFHPLAKPGAKAILAAGVQNKTFEMIDALFALSNEQLGELAKGPKEEYGKRAEELFKTVAKNIGLNVKKFTKDYEERDAEWEKIIQDNMTQAQKMNVRGTPTFFLNGRNTRARDFNSFKAEIDQILKGEDVSKKKVKN